MAYATASLPKFNVETEFDTDYITTGEEVLTALLELIPEEFREMVETEIINAIRELEEN